MALLATLVLALSGTPATGLYGTVRRGPTQPVCRVSEPCDAPGYVRLAFSRSGRIVGRIHTRRDGSYRIRLAPGRYTVRTDSRNVFERTPRPATATVPRAAYRRVNFALDTGIR
jgi:hypothetical protein